MAKGIIRDLSPSARVSSRRDQGSLADLSPSSIMDALRDTGRIMYSTITAFEPTIYRITEDDRFRITEDGHYRALEI